MTDEEKIFIRRINELHDRAQYNDTVCCTDFLTLAEQDTLGCEFPENEYSLDGGYEQAERRVAIFGAESAPLRLLCVAPKDKKFADALCHRDFLGALLSLGIKRQVLGDIVIHDNRGYLFCLESISDYIIDNLTSVKHTSVRCSVANELPQGAIALPEEKTVSVASLRADAVIAEIYNLSRSEAQELFPVGRVSLRGKVFDNPSYLLKDGDLISVRGLGRFICGGVCGHTRKGRLKLSVSVY